MILTINKEQLLLEIPTVWHPTLEHWSHSTVKMWPRLTLRSVVWKGAILGVWWQTKNGRFHYGRRRRFFLDTLYHRINAYWFRCRIVDRKMFMCFPLANYISYNVEQLIKVRKSGLMKWKQLYRIIYLQMKSSSVTWEL